MSNYGTSRGPKLNPKEDLIKLNILTLLFKGILVMNDKSKKITVPVKYKEFLSPNLRAFRVQITPEVISDKI